MRVTAVSSADATTEAAVDEQATQIPPVRGRRMKPVIDVEAAFRKTPKPRGRTLFWAAVVWIGFLLFIAVLANLLPLKDYGGIVDHLQPRTPPGLRAEFLGTDAVGRSVLSRLIFGARESLLVAAFATAVSLAAGLVIGIAAGFFRGKLDEAIGVVLDALLSLPSLVLLLALASVGRRDFTMLVIELAIVGTPTFARLARAATLAVVERDYVIAARVMGATNLRIMTRELLPAVTLRVSSFAFLFMSVVIVIEGSLSFLGLGIPPPHPSWGGMINDGRPYLQTQPYLVFIPAACMFFTVAAFTVLGDHARRHFDTRGSALE